MTFTEFVDHLRYQDRSESTVEGYLRDLRLFDRWFQTTNGEPLTPEGVTPLDLREYRAHLLNVRKLAGATVNRKLAAVRAWLAWAKKTDQIEVNPAQGIKGVRLSDPPPRWLSRKETYALLRELQKAEQLAAARARGSEGHPALVQARRDQAVVALLLHAGLRVGEVAALEVGEIEVSERKGRVMVRYGKGGKEREVPLHPGGPALFYGKGGHPLSERGVQYLVNKYATAAGLERIAVLMGHESLETTRRYVTPSTHDLVAAVEQVAWSDG